MQRNKIFLLTHGNVKCYVRGESHEQLTALLKQYGVTEFKLERAPGKSKYATSAIECVRDKLRKHELDRHAE